MSNEDKYLRYEGYYKRFGNSTRPALVRYEERWVADRRLTICNFFIDNKTFTNELAPNKQVNGKSYSICLLTNSQSIDKDCLVPLKFNHQSDACWKDLLLDAYRLSQNGDPLAHAILTVALDKFEWDNVVLQSALAYLDVNARNVIDGMIGYISWALSPQKISKIKEIILTCQAIFPPCLEEAAKHYRLTYDSLNVNTLTDQITRAYKDNSSPKNVNGFLKILAWMEHDEVSVTLQELNDYFPYLNGGYRNIAIKRFFHDVKKGVFAFTDDVIGVFSSQNYQYYSQFRYILENWPDFRNVSSDFLLDCIKTYRESNQQSLQAYNGVLDWAVRKSMELHRPVNLSYNSWLCLCEGGVLIDQYFRGFANFEIKYELDDLAFEDDSLTRNIEALRDRHSKRCFHYEEKQLIDPKTGQPTIDQETGLPKTQSIRVLEDRWKFDSDGYDKPYLDLFVNWDMRPVHEADPYVFSKEMIDVSIVEEKVKEYIEHKFNTLSPYISQRDHDEVVSMFMYPSSMKASLDEEAELGADPGVTLEIIQQSVKERLVELFGESLECDYDPTILSKALTDTQFSPNIKQKECFITSRKTYRGKTHVYCAPVLSDNPTLLTKRKCAICHGDMCFVTSIKRTSDWKAYKLIHLLEIIGYNVLDDTEAGLIPNHVYNQFVVQINKANRFYKRLVCRECGHILFPYNNNSRNLEYNRSKCLSPTCSEYNKEVYLSYCHTCKKGLIDSRDSKKCPNGLHICPECSSCCSNAFFEAQATKRRRLGLPVPAVWARNMGNGHADRGMIYCSKCGSQKVDVYAENNGNLQGRCPKCDPPPPLELPDGVRR